jgi:folate-binding protein YgfZ
VDSFVRHLKRHKLRSKVTVRDVKDEWRIFFDWSERREVTGKRVSDGGGGDRADIIQTDDPRLPALGRRTLMSCESKSIPEGFDPEQMTPLSAYTIRRYLHGVPEGHKEILRESALPMESNMDYLNGIDFRKGCYLGQELTIRTQHTGVIRKRILPVQLYTSDPPPELSYEPVNFDVKSGTDIKAEGGKRPAGKFLASVGNIGLALCRLENMTDLRVSAEGGTWKEGMEFNVASASADGEKVKVKAFVPDWLRTREQEKMEKRAKREDPAIN